MKVCTNKDSELTKAVLVIAQWHGVVRRQLALLSQFFVHCLADRAVSTIRAHNNVARVKANN
jgi:hypothetical protein